MSLKIDSLLIHGGTDGDVTTGAVTVPVYQTSTYKQDGLGENRGWEYSRTGNPTRDALEKLIADLEEGKYGFAFASGLAAINTVLSLFRSGDKLLVSDNIYGGTFRILDNVFKNFGITYEIVNTSDLSSIEKAIDDNVKAIYVESPANPLLTVTDIAEVAKISKKYNKLLIVDNTFLTPYLQRPLTLAADIVIHTGTKYLLFHSETISVLVTGNRQTLLSAKCHRRSTCSLGQFPGDKRHQNSRSKNGQTCFQRRKDCRMARRKRLCQQSLLSRTQIRSRIRSSEKTG